MAHGLMAHKKSLTAEAMQNFDSGYNNHQIDSDQNRRFSPSYLMPKMDSFNK